MRLVEVQERDGTYTLMDADDVASIHCYSTSIYVRLKHMKDALYLMGNYGELIRRLGIETDGMHYLDFDVPKWKPVTPARVTDEEKIPLKLDNGKFSFLRKNGEQETTE